MDVQISSHQHNTVEDRPDWLNRSVEENRFECHQQAKKTKLPQKPRKTTGSERRKRDIRNLKKRSKYVFVNFEFPGASAAIVVA